MSDHFVKKCSCGTVLSTCRCDAPDKRVEVVKDGCSKCKKEEPKETVYRGA
jgi:hypothetical protein